MPDVDSTIASLREAARRYDLDGDEVIRAARAIDVGEVDAFAVSGKLGAGKDTHAVEAMRSRGRTDVSHRFFAEALKRECNEVIALYLGNDTPGGFVAALDDEMAIGADNATFYADLLGGVERDALTDWDALQRDRLPIEQRKVLRRMLQYHGTECRRAQDDLYWVKLAVADVVADVLAGKSVYLTDCRFPNEADALRALGIHVVRLDVTAETQQQRIFDRDGHLPDPDTLTHASEVSLDDYEHFSIRIDNDGTFGETQQTMLAFLEQEASVRRLAA